MDRCLHTGSQCTPGAALEARDSMTARLGFFLSCVTAAALLPAPVRATTVEDSPIEDESPDPDLDATSSSGSLGVHHLFAAGKLTPGVTLRGGSGWFWGAFEGSFVFLVKPPPERSAFLGNQLGGYFMLRPFARSGFELEGGVGVDAYPLWGIHGDEWQVALAARLAAHARVHRNAGAFVTARAYPIATNGLELGVHRNGDRGLPVMFGAGVEWWP
jgi:hypothetical protein